MMFRDKSISKYYAFSLAAVFALTLAGCGGNGGTAAVDGDGDNGAVMECTAPQVGTYPDCTTPAPERPVADATAVMAKAMAIMALEPDATADPIKPASAQMNNRSMKPMPTQRARPGTMSSPWTRATVRLRSPIAWARSTHRTMTMMT